MITIPKFSRDEVGALVVDIGSSVARFGFAGEDTPKAVFDSVSINYAFYHKNFLRQLDAVWIHLRLLP